MRQRIRSHLTFANVVSLAALFVALGGTTYAATGGNFILGRANSASSTSSLSAPVAGKGLQVTNTSTHAGASALGLNVASGHAPFTVNSGAKVANLNADKLDGIDSTGFLPSANVQSWAWVAGPCVTGGDSGCQSTFSFGGMTLAAICHQDGANGHLQLFNNSSSNAVSAAYIDSSNNANQATAAAGAPIFDASTSSQLDYQGSLMHDTGLNSSPTPESANFEAEVQTNGSFALCGLHAVAVRSR
jgi:hypothetical protein